MGKLHLGSRRVVGVLVDWSHGAREGCGSGASATPDGHGGGDMGHLWGMRGEYFQQMGFDLCNLSRHGHIYDHSRLPLFFPRNQNSP